MTGRDQSCELKRLAEIDAVGREDYDKAKIAVIFGCYSSLVSGLLDAIEWGDTAYQYIERQRARIEGTTGDKQ